MKDFQLSTTINSKNETESNVIWSSNNEEYVSIDDDGVVSVKKYTPDEITISLTSLTDDNIKEEWKFNIIKKEFRLFTMHKDYNLYLDKKDIPININLAISSEYFTYSDIYQNLPYIEIFYNYDKSIISIDELGNMTPLKTGCTNLTINANGLGYTQANVCVKQNYINNHIKRIELSGKRQLTKHSTAVINVVAKSDDSTDTGWTILHYEYQKIGQKIVNEGYVAVKINERNTFRLPNVEDSGIMLFHTLNMNTFMTYVIDVR